MQLRTQSAMHAQDSVFYDRTDWHVIEAEAEITPQGEGVPPFALVVEAVGSIDCLAFVVTAQKVEGLRVFYFECYQKSNYFN